MKTYKESTYSDGKWFDVEINVPTPKELQAASELGNVRVVISNFSGSNGDSYSVARFDPETNEVMLKIGFRFQTTTTHSVYDFRGPKARSLAIETALELLVGRY